MCFMRGGRQASINGTALGRGGNNETQERVKILSDFLSDYEQAVRRAANEAERRPRSCLCLITVLPHTA